LASGNDVGDPAVRGGDVSIRTAALVAVVVAAGVAAATALPSRADNAAPPTTTTTVVSTTTTTTTTAPITTTPAPAPAPGKKKLASSAKALRIVRSFPAAGDLLVPKTVVRLTPDPHARIIRVLTQFRPDFRIQEILALTTRIGTDGKPWYRINLPMRPNGTFGWIPARVVSLTPTVSQIVIHRNARTIDVYFHGKHALHAIVAVGAPGMETPLGHFYVQVRFVPDDSFLGVFALETSAYSKLSEWPGGGVVGIHGTSAPQLLGQAVSHGCVRVSNQTAAALRRLAPVGTPITITD
jgi:lipoprotein-anchoring transpeptidase ErfK/SrfK